MVYHGFLRVGEIVFTEVGHEHKILGVNDVKIRTPNNSRVIDVHIVFFFKKLTKKENGR
jgi:hypothetical protein